jgi:hypothetical protein
MKLMEERLNVERSADFDEVPFTIRASSKAFKILSSGLYSNKPKAVLRELATNCWDSHVAAGCPERPFQVHLPNQLEPWLSLRDFGKSLTDKEIREVYTSYFFSDKTNTDEMCGCMGLGSKSPFSYTDNFTVTTWKDGVKRVYTAFINEVGCPSIAHLGEEESTEENGLEVSFAVEPKDFQSFRYEAEQVYRWFTVKPDVVGQEVKLDRPKPDYESDTWELYRDNSIGAFLLMGNVAYPLNFYSANAYNPLLNRISIVVKCNIGEAEMTASRESLEYTDLTNNTLKKAVEDALKHWESLVKAELDGQPTLWDATIFYTKNKLWLKNATWKNIVLTEDITLPSPVKVDTCKYSYKTKVKYRHEETLYSVQPSDNIRFIINDLPRGTKLRVQQYINTIRQNGNPMAIVLKFATQAEQDDLLGLLEVPAIQIIKASILPKVVRPKAKNCGKKLVYPFCPNGHNNKTYWENPQELKNITGGVYVELDMWSINDNWSPSKLSILIDNLKKCGYDPGQVYGLRKGSLKKIKGNPNWKSIVQFMNECIAKHSHEEDYIVNHDNYLQYLSLVDLRKELYQAGIDIGLLADKIEYVQKNNYRLAALNRIYSYAGKATNNYTDTPEIITAKDKYPLLFFILDNVSANDWQEQLANIVDYVKLVNNKKELSNEVQSV